MRKPYLLFRFRFEARSMMAAGQNVPELGGYDFEFTIKVPAELECPVCQLTMKNPIQIEGCGHRFCKICSQGFLRLVMADHGHYTSD